MEWKIFRALASRHPSSSASQRHLFQVGLKQGWAPVLGAVVGDLTNQQICAEVADYLRTELSRHKGLWEVLAKPELPPQVGFQVLQASLAVRIYHWLRQISPFIWMGVIQDFDSEVRQAFMTILGTKMSQRQCLQLEWPMREGGFGLRSAESLAPAGLFRPPCGGGTPRSRDGAAARLGVGAARRYGGLRSTSPPTRAAA